MSLKKSILICRLQNDDHIHKQDLVCQSGPFCNNWSKCRQTETLTYRNVDRPKLKQRQTKTSTYQNINRPKLRQTETSTDQRVDRPKRRQTKPNQNVELPKHRPTKKCWHTKRRQTETWTVQFSTLYSRVFVFIILGMYYIYIHTYVWLVGCTLCSSTHNFIIIGGHSTYQYQQN